MRLLINCSIVVFIFIAKSYGQDKEKAGYLASHSVVWNGDFKNEAALFAPEILRSQLIMIGEGHGIARSYEIQADLIKCLKHKTGFKYLLQELGFCDGLLLNAYLHTGDETKLQDFFAIHKGTFYWNKNIRDFYRKLYVLNSNLPEKQKIVILPVDVEHAYRAGIEYLQTQVFIGELSETAEGKKLLAINAAQWKGKDIADGYEKIYSAFVKNSQGYKTKMGAAYDDAAYLMRNIHETLSMALNGNGKRRDTVMLENFNYYKKRYHLDGQKLAGMFGTYHIRQVNKTDEGHFAGLLKSSGAVKSISAAMMCYSAGYIMMPKGYTASQIDTAKILYKKVANTFPYIVESLEDGELLVPYQTKNKAVVFNIAAPGSPFNGTKSFLVEDDQFANVDQLYQMIILINDSPAAEPMDGGIDEVK